MLKDRSRPPRREREAPKYKDVTSVVEEIIAKHSTMVGMHEELKERLVIVVRTDHPANRV
jgi:hypothetical protein